MTQQLFISFLAVAVSKIVTMKTVIALFLFALGSAQAKLRADGRRAHRGLVVSDYRITCGECNASLATTTCTVYDYSSGAADPVETFDCDCPAECPADAADTFQCDVPSSLSSGVVGDGSFLISLDGGAAAQCRFEPPPASTAECYVSYCPPPPERKLLCDPCDNNEVSCELFEDGTVVDTLACECPDGDCSTNFDCLAASAVAAGDIPFTVGVDDVEFSGMCKVDPTAAASTSVICQEECTTEEPTAKVSVNVSSSLLPFV